MNRGKGLVSTHILEADKLTTLHQTHDATTGYVDTQLLNYIAHLVVAGVVVVAIVTGAAI